MEVYVDNVKIEMKQKNFKTLGRAIFEINKKLLKENKILQEIYVNGNTLRDNDVIEGKDLKVIEVTTKTHGGIILESILEARKYIDKCSENFYELGANGQEVFTDEDEIRVIEMMMFLRWFYNLLLIIQENRILDFVYADFDEYIDEFKKGMEGAEKAYEEGDFLSFVDIMEFSVGDLLGRFYENMDEYYSDIAEEENRKRLLN